MWTNNRYAYRDFFYATWDKYHRREVLTSLENQLLEIILLHPEYQFIFANDSLKAQDYFPELGDINPFLHLSLHLGLKEQLATNRPLGIQAIYARLLEQKQDPHLVQHLMMEQIAEMIHGASKGAVLDDATYLAGLRKLIF